MKTKTTGFIAVIVVVAVFAGAAFAAPSSNNEWQVVKKTSQNDAPRAVVRGEAKWFKVLIMDRHEKGEEVRITLPLSLIKGIACLASDKHVRCHGRDLDLDFVEILDQLEKAGPLALIEIGDDEGMIKVWIE